MRPPMERKVGVDLMPAMELPPIHELLRKELGRELKRIREEERDRMTQGELAEKAGIQRRTVGYVESGDNSNLDNYIKIAEALEVDWGWLNTQAWMFVQSRIRASRMGN